MIAVHYLQSPRARPPRRSSGRAFPTPLLPKLSAANPDQKVKKQVKRESLMLSNEREEESEGEPCELVSA